MCTGQIAGVEAAVHAVRSSFLREDTEAVLLIDASNAFNSLNRVVALHNIRQLYPSFAPILINTYRSAAALYIGGDSSARLKKCEDQRRIVFATTGSRIYFPYTL